MIGIDRYEEHKKVVVKRRDLTRMFVTLSLHGLCGEFLRFPSGT
jgi:hypothetical protein